MTKFYENTYKEMFYSNGASTWATRRIHKALELRTKQFNSKKILEIGGGEGFHVEYVDQNYNEYWLTDLDPRPLDGLAADLFRQGKLFIKKEDAAKLSFKTDTFDRVIFMCVLHHLNDLPNSLSEARRVVKNGGHVSIYLPCDPGIVYRFIRKIFTAKQAKRLNADYELLNALEHRNHFLGIYLVLKNVFNKDIMKIQKWPIPIPSWNLNLYYILHVKIVKD